MDYDYQHNAIIQRIKDEKLRERIISIIEKVLEKKHLLWNFVKYPEMVDHCERHTKNVFDLLTRLLVFSQNHLLDSQLSIGNVKPLNDAELFCLIFCVWFHDIGGRGIAEEDKKFLSPLHARMEHPFIGEEVFLGLASSLGFTEEEKVAIGELVPPHSSKVDINKLKPRIVNGQEVRMKLLAVLVSLADACDTQEKRVGGEDEVEVRLSQLKAYLDKFKEEKRQLEEVKEQLEKQKPLPEKELSSLQGMVKELQEVIDYLNTAPDHYYKHLSVENVFFTSTSIILKKKYDVRRVYKEYCTYNSFDDYFNDALSDVQKELDRIRPYFPEYGITITEVRPYDEQQDELKLLEEQLMINLPDISPFKTLKEKMKENTDLKIFPTIEDLKEDGIVYFDKEIANEVINALKSERYCLVTGSISSRKTTFALSLAYHLQRDHSFLVYYLEVKEGGRYENLIQRIKFYDKENVLFVMDDCHNSPDDMGYLVNEVKLNMKKAKFLFVSRNIPEEVFEKEENNYFKKLKTVTYIDDIKKVFIGIISKFCAYNKIGNWEERIGNIDEVIKKCENNFYLLNEFLKIWKPEKEFLNEVSIQKIYSSFYEKYLKHGKKDIKWKRNSLLAALSAIYQFGVNIPTEFLDSQGLGVYGGSLEKVYDQMKEKEGLIYESPVDEGRYFKVGSHPFFAEMVLRVLDWKHDLRTLKNVTQSREDFTIEICKKFLIRIRNLQLLSAIYKSREMKIGRKLVEDEAVSSVVRELLRDFKNFASIAMVLRILNKFGIKKEVKNKLLTSEILEQWCESISLNSPNALNSLLRELRIFDDFKRVEFLGNVKIGEVIKIYKKAISESKLDIDILIDLKRFFNRELINIILLQLTKEEIKNIFNASWEKKLSLYNFYRRTNIQALPSHFNDAWSEFLSEKSAEVMAWLLEESTPLDKIGKFVSVTYWHKKLQILYNNFFFGNQLFLNKLGKATLEEIAKFLYEIARIKFRKNQLIGVKLARSLLTLQHRGFILDARPWEAAEKAERLILQGRVLCINPIQFSVAGDHGIYTVFIEDNIVKCTCTGYKSFGFCTHSMAVFKKNWEKLLEMKIRNASLSAIQRMLRVADELELEGLTAKIMSIIEEPQFNITQKVSDANAMDLAYFLWNILFVPSLDFKYHKLLNVNVDLMSKIKNAKVEEIVFLSWNLFEGHLTLSTIFNEGILSELVLSGEEKIGERLALIGFLDFASPDLLERMNLTDLKTTVLNSEIEIERWLRGRFMQRRMESRIHYMRHLASLFLFILGIRGLRKIDEEKCFTFLVRAFQSIHPQYITGVIYQLQKTFEILKERNKTTENSEKLFKETIEWLLQKTKEYYEQLNEFI